jgi:hypothetical protein
MLARKFRYARAQPCRTAKQIRAAKLLITPISLLIIADVTTIVHQRPPLSYA